LNFETICPGFNKLALFLSDRNLSMKLGHMVSKFNVYSDWQRLSFLI